MKKTIKQQFFFPHTPEMMWEYLTKPELLELWLMKNDFQPVVGADFQFRAGPIPSLNFDGIMHCRVLEIDPFKKLSYTWKCGPGNGEITLDTVVVWRLVPKDEGTELLLEHSGFAIPENLGFFNGMNPGWMEKLENIDNLIKTGKHGNICS